MFIVGHYVYYYCETGELICCGEVVMGIDGYYVEYYE